MTNKEQFVNFITALTPNEEGRVLFKTHETFSLGGLNHRTCNAGQTNFIIMVNTNFDDDLNGHFGDNVMTRIDSYEEL